MRAETLVKASSMVLLLSKYLYSYFNIIILLFHQSIGKKLPKFYFLIFVIGKLIVLLSGNSVDLANREHIRVIRLLTVLVVVHAAITFDLVARRMCLTLGRSRWSTGT